VGGVSNHTKGPWRFVTLGRKAEAHSAWEIEGDRTFHQNGLVSSGTNFAQVTGNSAEQLEANARLIAAAPELLDEVRTLIEVLERGAETPEDRDGIISYAKSIIAKATGGDS